MNGEEEFSVPEAALAWSKKSTLLELASQRGETIRKSTKELRADKEIVLVAVAQNGMALEFASESLRADPEVVLAATAQNGNAMQFAASHLQADRNFVMAAIGQRHTEEERLPDTRPGTALRYASKNLHSNAPYGENLPHHEVQAHADLDARKTLHRKAASVKDLL